MSIYHELGRAAAEKRAVGSALATGAKLVAPMVAPGLAEKTLGSDAGAATSHAITGAYSLAAPWTIPVNAVAGRMEGPVDADTAYKLYNEPWYKTIGRLFTDTGTMSRMQITGKNWGEFKDIVNQGKARAEARARGEYVPPLPGQPGYEESQQSAQPGAATSPAQQPQQPQYPQQQQAIGALQQMHQQNPGSVDRMFQSQNPLQTLSQMGSLMAPQHAGVFAQLGQRAGQLAVKTPAAPAKPAGGSAWAGLKGFAAGGAGKSPAPSADTRPHQPLM